MWLSVAIACAVGAPRAHALRANGGSWLRVQLKAGPAPVEFERTWAATPVARLDAVFGADRFVLSVGSHALWFGFRLQPDVVAHAHDAAALEHAVAVTLSREGEYGAVRVSDDVARALVALDLHGLEHRMRASALQRGGRVGERMRREPALARQLAAIAVRQALRRLGVFSCDS